MDFFFSTLNAGLRTRHHKDLGEALKNTFNKLGHLRIDELSPENYLRAFTAFREESITPEEFVEEFSRQADRIVPENHKFKDRLIDEHQKFMFFGIQDRDKSKILIKINEKTKENLNAALDLEKNATKKYFQYARESEESGDKEAVRLFKALAEVEAGHQFALRKMLEAIKE